MAKKFWTFIGNDKYDIGLTGSTVYVYDKNGTELATFKDLTYAYNAIISPLGDIFVVKTTDEKTYSNSFGWITIKSVDLKTKAKKTIIDIETQ